MKVSILRLVSLAAFLIVLTAASANSDTDHEVFTTKHGILTFVNEDGDSDVLAVEVKLNGKTLLTSRNSRDRYDLPQHLMLPIMLIPYQYTPKSKPSDKPMKIDRVVVEEGPDGNCIRQLIILDFTMEKPFVSERFGDNPNDEYCLRLEKIKWGKKETYLYLFGPKKFVYYTGGRVIGPLD